jgi:hypothetical protein
VNRRKRMLNDLDQDIRDHVEVETQDDSFAQLTGNPSLEQARINV